MTYTKDTYIPTAYVVPEVNLTKWSHTKGTAQLTAATYSPTTGVTILFTDLYPTSRFSATYIGFTLEVWKNSRAYVNHISVNGLLLATQCDSNYLNDEAYDDFDMWVVCFAGYNILLSSLQQKNFLLLC